MFTGIITNKGQVAEINRCGTSAMIRIAARDELVGLAVGDSINVNGICMTARKVISPKSFVADLMGTTLAVTAVSDWTIGRKVNLEQPLAMGSPLGGHLVQGHVDGVGTIISIIDQSDWRQLRIKMPEGAAELIAPKGSVTVDGVSLTVSAVAEADDTCPWFEVGLIPETLQSTTLGKLKLHDRVNLETDLLARQLQRLLDVREQSATVIERLTAARKQEKAAKEEAARLAAAEAEAEQINPELHSHSAEGVWTMVNLPIDTENL